MAAVTYLDVVNKVLRRLREPAVTAINESEYSLLIAEFVNVVKREVEDSWNWSALRNTLTATTTVGLFNYILVGSGVRTRILDVINDTSNSFLSYQTARWFDAMFLTPATVQTGAPANWNMNGVDSNGDSQIDFFPVPDGVYDIRINCILPQADLELDTDTLLVPSQIVIEGVLARAISERGEDGSYIEQEQRYQRILSDYIAIDSGNREDELIWNYV